MNLSLVNTLFIGCLFIHNGKNYLVNEIRSLDENNETIKLWLVDAEADFTALEISYTEFYEKVVK